MTPMDASLFPLEAPGLLPHAGPMCCIDRLLASDTASALAEVVLEEGHSLLDGETLVPCGFVELAAQTAGAMQGFDRKRLHLPPQFGYLAGAQDFAVHGTARVGDRLEIAVQLEAELGGVRLITAEIRGAGGVLATGRLKVYVPEN